MLTGDGRTEAILNITNLLVESRIGELNAYLDTIYEKCDNNRNGEYSGIIIDTFDEMENRFDDGYIGILEARFSQLGSMRSKRIKVGAEYTDEQISKTLSY